MVTKAMNITLNQYRIGKRKQLIEEAGFAKNPLQINSQLLGDTTFFYLISLVFNTTSTDIGYTHISRLVHQFKSTITKQIIQSGKTPYQFKGDILPDLTTAEYRSNDKCFHIHLLISKWTTSDTFNEIFSKRIKRYIWSDIFKFNLDGDVGDFEGRKLKVIDFDLKEIDPKDNRQPIQDYILKTDSDLVHLSKSIKTKIRNNNILADKILRGTKTIHPSIYRSNILKVIPDEILKQDLKKRPKNFLFQIATNNKPPVRAAHTTNHMKTSKNTSLTEEMNHLETNHEFAERVKHVYENKNPKGWVGKLPINDDTDWVEEFRKLYEKAA